MRFDPRLKFPTNLEEALALALVYSVGVFFMNVDLALAEMILVTMMGPRDPDDYFPKHKYTIQAYLLAVWNTVIVAYGFYLRLDCIYPYHPRRPYLRRCRDAGIILLGLLLGMTLPAVEEAKLKSLPTELRKCWDYITNDNVTELGRIPTNVTMALMMPFMSGVGCMRLYQDFVGWIARARFMHRRV